jgi:Fic family protein
MLFTAPTLDPVETEVLTRISELRAAMRMQLNEPRRWQGSLRRLSFARNIRGSNSIEGYDADLDDAAAVALGEEPLDASEETRLALEGYRNAMTYVLQLAQEPPVEFSEQLIKSLHFMMTSYDLKNRPGRWRLGPIFVRDDEAEVIVHEGADIAEVDRLMKELVTYMTSPSDEADLIRGAMVHLNLVMVHPFRDGNGRMARCLQSLMLSSGGVLSPIFMSIEEYLGRNTQDYYDILASVGGGSWAPERDARSWIRFVLTAHLRQALTLQRRIRDSERVWSELERIIEKRGLPDRMIHAMFDAVVGFRVRNAIYRATLADAEEEISEQSASRDFKVMTDLGLLAARGERRGRYYVRSGALSEVYESVLQARTARDNSDPFAT